MSWDDFQTVESVSDRPSLIWSSQGSGGSGKSHFLLTAPKPLWVAVFSDPRGMDSLMKKDEFRDQDIRWRHYNFNPGKLKEEDRPKAAQEAIDLFLEDYVTALQHARTIGFDKEDLLYEALRYARLESYTDRPANYYELNLEYRGLFSDAADAGVNLGVIRGMKEQWGTDDRGKPSGTGKMIPRGQREVNEMVEIVLDHRFDEESGEFKSRIHEKCRVGNATELIGQEFGNLDFATLAATLYPDIDSEAWQ